MTVDTKECPFCGEAIKVTAKKCRHCGEFLDGYTRDEVWQEINTSGGLAVGKDVSASRDFIGRDHLRKQRMSWDTRGGCLNIYFITQAAVVLIILFLGVATYRTEIQISTQRLIAKFLERIEKENVRPDIVQVPTPVATFTSIAIALPTDNIPLPISTLTPMSTPVLASDLYVHVEGMGIAPATETNLANRKRAALLAAEVDAKRNLVLWVEGVQVGSVSIINQGNVTTDIIQKTISFSPPNAKVIESRYDDETGTATVTLELVIDKISSP